MQQQQQQQQLQLTNQTVSQSSLQFQLQTQPTHHQQHLGNNIIVVRGSRNEHGEIVIQNKQDIFTFLSEHHQQQQQQQQLQQQQQQLQQQNEKATVATLTQLPSTTTVARKTSISLIANNVGIGNSGTTSSSLSSSSSSSSSSTAATNTAVTIPKETNTILLQTPINASQLETVLLQSGQLKKSNSTVTSGTERPFLFKNVSMSMTANASTIIKLA
ncbi:hypothetical protein CVS40_9407 [Lucilia cuprina]|nr:hypothetical protein CVS40_9407 [Lucilia cuprina]